MATATVVRAAHATLTSTTVDTINLTDTCAQLNIINRGGAATLTVTVAQAGGTAATPVALAADTYIVPSGLSLTIALTPQRGTTQVKVLGSDNDYSVQIVG